jgi:hypothetical protein
MKTNTVSTLWQRISFLIAQIFVLIAAALAGNYPSCSITPAAINGNIIS